jgi:drug/metabolite transporter (DMT)-like permease
MSPTLLGVLIGLGAAASSAIAHVLSKSALTEMNLVYFLKLRTTGAAGAMLLAALVMGDYRLLEKLSPTQFAWIAAGGVLSPWLISTLMFWALERMPLNVHAPLFRSSPVFGLVFAAFVFGEKVRVADLVGVLAVVVGVAAFSWHRANEPDHRRRVGVFPILAVLAAAAVYGLTLSLWRIYSAWTSGTNINLIQCTVGTLLWLGVDACRRGQCPVGRVHVANALLSGVLIFGVSNVLSIEALRFLPSPTVNALNSTSTLMVGVLAGLLLEETWTSWDWLWALVIVGGVAAMALG